MKKGIGGFVGAVLLASFFMVACAGPAQETRVGGAVSVVVGTPMVEMGKQAKVVLYGTGFMPKQEILFLFKDASGVQSDIGSALKPTPVPDEIGAWVTVWECGDYMVLVKPGVYTLTVTDSELKTLAQVPIGFYATEKKEKKEK